MADITIVETGRERLNDIRPLWEQLNTHHASISKHFRAHFEKYSFDDRKTYLNDKGELSTLRIFLAQADGRNIGYAVASVDPAGNGEIESIFVEPDWRGKKVGDRLMTATLDWLRSHGPQGITVAVVYGNEQAHPFYAKYGFVPRTTYLTIPEDDEPICRPTSGPWPGSRP